LLATQSSDPSDEHPQEEIRDMMSGNLSNLKKSDPPASWSPDVAQQRRHINATKKTPST